MHDTINPIYLCEHALGNGFHKRPHQPEPCPCGNNGQKELGKVEETPFVLGGSASLY